MAVSVVCSPTLSAEHHPTDEDLSVGTPGSGKDGAREVCFSTKVLFLASWLLAQPALIELFLLLWRSDIKALQS